MPGGVPYIVGNEAAERFSFYGMRSILIVFMTTSLMSGSGRLAVMDRNEAAGWFHQFVATVYFLLILGAIISDGILGKYRTILCLSIVYCCGHLALALNDTRMGLFLEFLIALGREVSNHVSRRTLAINSDPVISICFPESLAGFISRSTLVLQFPFISAHSCSTIRALVRIGPSACPAF